MLTLNDYLYNGDTVVKILHSYSQDLKASAIENNNGIDLAHSNCLLLMIDLLEHNDFLTTQSQKIREFYKFMAEKYPFLAFTFKGRIKSLIRLEEKINGNIVEFIYDYHREYGVYPPEAEIKDQISRIKDLIAYRIVVSLPRCHVNPGEDKQEREKGYLYEIANALPDFLEERGFQPELSGIETVRRSKNRIGSIIGIISRTPTISAIDLFIFPFLTIPRAATSRYRSVQKRWTTMRRSVLPIISDTRSVRRVSAHGARRSRRERMRILMMLMKEA